MNAVQAESKENYGRNTQSLDNELGCEPTCSRYALWNVDININTGANEMNTYFSRWMSHGTFILEEGVCEDEKMHWIL